jgi:Tol biopolymer transport system component
MVAGVAVLTALALGVAYFNRSAANPSAVQLAFAPPENVAFDNLMHEQVKVSPDGKKLVFTGRSADGKRQLWLRSLDSMEAQPLPGTDDGRGPFWSPDSRSVGFAARGKLKRVDLAGGRPQILCDAPELFGGTWSRTGVILFAPFTQGALYQIPAAGGEALPVIGLDSAHQEPGLQDPCFLPDGRHFLYRNGGEMGQGVFAGSLDSKAVVRVLADDTAALYAPPGWLLFVRNGGLMAQPFDADRLEVKGKAVPLTRPTNLASIYGTPFSVSENGVLIWQGDRTHNYQLVWFDRAGKQTGTAGPPIKTLVGQGPRFSPDQKRVVFHRVDPETRAADIWMIDLEDNLPTRLTADQIFKSRPIWSPDSRRVVYGGRSGIHQVYANNGGVVEVLLKGEANVSSYAPTDWSPDGRFILFSRVNKLTQRDIWVLPLSANATPYPFLNTQFEEYRAQISPDGHWLAYVSDESGNYEVYVQPFSSDGKLVGEKKRISTGGGNQPRWRRDGQELFYIAADGQMMVVGAKISGTIFEPSPPNPLFKTQMLATPVQSNSDYDVTADGQRFLIGTMVGVATPVSIILNWTAGLEQ